MLLRSFALALCLLFVSGLTLAQDTRYVSDEVFIVLHSGPGTSYRWKGKLTPGARLSVTETSEDGAWSKVTTSRGSDGWVQSEYLTGNLPAQVKLPQAQQRADALAQKNAELNQQLTDLQNAHTQLQEQLTASDGSLQGVSEELHQLKQISGKAVQLDTDNRRLVEEAQNLRSETEMLEAENQRLQDKLNSEAFMNGALAVLLGVIITLVVPRLWPKRKRSSSWA